MPRPPLEGHTVQRYDGDLNSLHLAALEMGGLVLDQFRLALNSLKRQDTSMARVVLEREDEVDQLERKIAADVVTVIARRGPVARDLRVLISISKAVTDLERIGDEATRIADLVIGIYESDPSPPGKPLLRDVVIMGKQTMEMLSEAIESFDILNVARAREMLCQENQLGQEFQSSLRRLATYLLEDARNVGHAIHIVLMIKAIERSGDYARDIAGYTVYMISGEDVRHDRGSFCKSGNATRHGRRRSEN